MQDLEKRIEVYLQETKKDFLNVVICDDKIQEMSSRLVRLSAYQEESW